MNTRQFWLGSMALAAVTLASPGMAQQAANTGSYYPYALHCAEGAAASARGAPFDHSALDDCGRAIASEPLSRASTAAAYTHRGMMKMANRDFAGAEGDFDKAIANYSRFTDAYLSRAWLNNLRKRPRQALADANQAIKVGGPSAKAYYNRAIAQEGLGKTREAYADYRIAARLDPNWDRPRRELARFTVTPRR